MEVSVYNVKGEDTGRKVVLDDAVFGIEPNDHAIYLAVRAVAEHVVGTLTLLYSWEELVCSGLVLAAIALS